jgi:dolichol-phosphate mannosyltransferase
MKEAPAAHIASRSTLIFTTCYNERENVGALIDQIVKFAPDVDILVVDDSSPDGTWDVLAQKAAEYPQLTCVKRPRKLGIGSAHKYALYYAMREGYRTLLTMDADFSHNPKDIPALLARHGPNAFVTGSRYCKGGKSDYTGYRNVVSRVGNVMARWALGVQTKELTTYFRVFDIAAIRRLPLRRISASGYSYGVQLIYHLHRAGVDLREVPIHFVDRTHGKSKIPRAQIFWSVIDLARLSLARLRRFRDAEPDPVVSVACRECGDRVLAVKMRGIRLPTCVCLCCGLEQVPADLANSASG